MLVNILYFQGGSIPGLWTGLDHGLDSGLTVLQALINCFHYNTILSC